MRIVQYTPREFELGLRSRGGQTVEEIGTRDLFRSELVLCVARGDSTKYL